MLFVCSKNAQDQVEPVVLRSLAGGPGQDSGHDGICLGLAHPGREGAGDGLPRPGPDKLGGRRRLACPLLSGARSLPSIKFWPCSQFPFPFLTAQASLPEEER